MNLSKDTPVLPGEAYRLENLLQKEIPGAFSSTFCQLGMIRRALDLNLTEALVIYQLRKLYHDTPHVNQLHKNKLGRDIRPCVFVGKNDWKDLAGVERIDNVLNSLRKKGLVQYRAKSIDGVRGRSIYLKFNKVLGKTEKQFKEDYEYALHANDRNIFKKMLYTQPEPVLPLLPCKLVFSGALNRVYDSNFEDLCRIIEDWGRDGETGRMVQRVTDLDYYGSETHRNVFEFYNMDTHPIQNNARLDDHVKHRIRETAGLFSDSLGDNYDNWLPQPNYVDKSAQLFRNGNFRIRTLQMIGISIRYFSGMKSLFSGKNKKYTRLYQVYNDVDELWSKLCFSLKHENDHIKLSDETPAFDINSIVLDQLVQAEWLEIQFLFKQRYGRGLLKRWITNHKGFSNDLTKLGTYAKLFPNDTETLKEYSDIKGVSGNTKSALQTYEEITDPKHRKLVRSFYPGVCEQLNLRE